MKYHRHPSTNYKLNQTGKTEAKRFNKNAYQAFVGFATLYLVYMFVFYKKTFGYDDRYNLYVFWIPNITGIIALGIYRRKFLLKTYLDGKGFFYRLYVIGFYFIQGIIFSYISIGAFAQYTWEYYNLREADKNPIVTIKCPVERFYVGKNCSVDLRFEHEAETVSVSYNFIKPYQKENPDDYEFVATAQKGLWNHYVIRYWRIEKKMGTAP